jgi:hypothetical protein
MTVEIRVLGWLHIGLATAGLITGASFCLSIWLIPGKLSAFMLVFAVPIFLACAILLFVPQLIGGIGLVRGHRWARVVILLLSALLLIVFPIGTLLGGFGFWALLGDRAAAWLGETGSNR